MRSPYGGFTATRPARRRRGRKLRQLAALEEEPLVEARARGIRLGVADRDGIAVEAADAPRRQQVPAGGAPRLRARSLGPGMRVVLLPALEAEPLAEQPGRDVGGDQRGLDRQRAGPAHRVDERAAGRRDRRPARADQDRGCEVLLERRRALPAAVAAPVQAVARQVDRDRDGAARGVHIDAKRGRHRGRPRAASPVRSRNWSTTASLTRCAPNCVCVTPGTAPEKSTVERVRRRPCAWPSRSRARPRRARCASATGNRAICHSTRRPRRDSRQAR